MTREELISALTAKPVPFTSGGRSCFLRPLLSIDMLAAQAWAKARDDKSGNSKFLFVRSLCDEQGNRLLTDDDVDLVDNFIGGYVDAVMRRVFEISGMGGADADEKKA